MKDIETKIELINKLPIDKLNERITLMKRLTDDILYEKKRYQEILDNIENIPNNKTYNNHKLDELLDIFDDSILEEKITIYRSFSTKVEDEIKTIFNKFEGTDSE